MRKTAKQKSCFRVIECDNHAFQKFIHACKVSLNYNKCPVYETLFSSRCDIFKYEITYTMYDSVENFVSENDVDIIVITETSLPQVNKDEDIFIPDDTLFRKDRKQAGGLGLCKYCRLFIGLGSFIPIEPTQPRATVDIS
ncbi:hypothetical protein WA026_022843 [Henosepilachna vigintioctopunctata]|uniref:Uncharacterized protein n=1 Tax=Henosepilachna vigintioctopunctata TaxID=420089 RepID=A0AAW1V1Z3_9CUCU